jgi:hypothetical protein
VNIPSPRSNTGEKNMSKKRSRRSSSAKKASPAQLAARARFTAMVKSGSFSKNPKKAKKAASAKKRVAKKAARKSRPKHKKAHAHKAHRRNDASFSADLLPKGKGRKARAAKPLSAAAKKAHAHKAHRRNDASLAAPKESAEETAAFMAEAQQGERAAKRAAKTPAQKKAAKARKAAKAKNKKQLFELKMGIAKTRAALAKEGKLPRLKKGEKRGKVGAKRRILRAKKAALNLQRSSYSGGLSAADQKMLQASGLMKVSRANPGVGDIFKDFVTLAPQIGAHAVGLAGVAVAGQKLGTMLAEAVRGKEADGKTLKAAPTEGVSAFVCNNAVTISSVAAAIAAYEAAKHLSPKSRPFAGALLMGGLAAAFVHAAAKIKIKSKDDKGVESSKSLGRVFGLPLGPLAGFVDIGGRQLAVNGMGEFVSVDGMGEFVSVDGMGDFVALSGNTLTGSSLGDFVALSGNTLTGSSLGEYMALSGSTLTGSSLGEISQMSESRQGGRALNSPGDVPVEDFLEEDEDDEGSLSGSIFDD